MLGLLLLLETEEDRLSFQSLYEQTYLRFLYTARKILSSQMDAEDVVHNVYVKIADNYSIYRNKSILDMTRIGFIMTRHMSLNRARAIERHADFSFEAKEYLYTDGDCVLNKVIREETMERLKDSLQELDQEERDILMLRFSHNLSFKQIGNIMEIKAKTAEMRLWRTKLKLRKLMKDVR